jgi:hypothetical protein
MASSMMHIYSISLSALKLLADVRQIRCLICSGLLTLLSLRCVPSPTIVSGADSLWLNSMSLHELARAAQAS